MEYQLTSSIPKTAVFIDPSSEHFLRDRLFDTGNAALNRDGTLLPFARMREHLQAQGIPVHTADYLRSGEVLAEVNHYWSLGMLEGYRPLLGRKDVRLRGFILFEPPLIAPHMYHALPEITQHFETAYVHNIKGDGYILQGVDTEKLSKLYWPQPYNAPVEPYWSQTDRLNKVVVIAGNHNPRFRKPEYYSRRIRAVAELVQIDAIDLFGRGWEQWWTRHSAWLPYWAHRRALMKAYKGTCDSKLEVLSRYRFSLCLENMPMNGYITEKLFDCLYAGTVPVYLGSPDISEHVNPDVFIDLRKYKSYSQMFDDISKMSESQWRKIRDAGKTFLRSQKMNNYFSFLTDIYNITNKSML